MKKKLKSLILENAQKINQLKYAIKASFKERNENPIAWQNACKVFHELYDSLAFPGGLEKGLVLLKKQHPEVIVAALSYLEADPFCFRSGYVKQKLAGLLKKVNLTSSQIDQLQDFLIVAVGSIGRREFREYCRLAKYIADDKFCKRLQDIIEKSDDLSVVQRAEKMLAVIAISSIYRLIRLLIKPF